MPREIEATYGALVGWQHNDFNGQVVLKLQSVRPNRTLGQDDLDSSHYVMTRNQALLLGNYLLTVSGQTPPKHRRRGLLGRLFSART